MARIFFNGCACAVTLLATHVTQSRADRRTDEPAPGCLTHVCTPDCPSTSQQEQLCDVFGNCFATLGCASVDDGCSPGDQITLCWPEH
jgi:hypothetical protein